MRLLLVESDLDYADELYSIVEQDYVVDLAHYGEDAEYLANINNYDTIAVSYDLPDMTGVELCKKVRDSNNNSPILFLAHDTPTKIKGLHAGADISIRKPVNKRELSASLKALIRRKSGYPSNLINLKGITIDLYNRTVCVKGKLVSLTRKEFELLEYLVMNINKVISRERLMEQVWKEGMHLLSNTDVVHIKRLRDKIEKPFGVKLITTVKGIGYKIES